MKIKRNISNWSIVTKTCILLSLILGVWSVFLIAQNAYFVGNNEQLELAIKKKQEIIKQNIGINNYSKTQNTKELLEKARKYRIIWSKISQTLLSYETQDIRFQSFAISPEGKVSISGVGRNTNAITKILTTLKNTNTIIDPFISNISKSTEGGINSLQFQLSFTLSLQ